QRQVFFKFVGIFFGIFFCQVSFLNKKKWKDEDLQRMCSFSGLQQRLERGRLRHGRPRRGSFPQKNSRLLEQSLLGKDEGKDRRRAENLEEELPVFCLLAHNGTNVFCLPEKKKKNI